VAPSTVKRWFPNGDFDRETDRWATLCGEENPVTKFLREERSRGKRRKAIARRDTRET